MPDAANTKAMVPTYPALPRDAISRLVIFLGRSNIPNDPFSRIFNALDVRRDAMAREMVLNGATQRRHATRLEKPFNDDKTMTLADELLLPLLNQIEQLLEYKPAADVEIRLPLPEQSKLTRRMVKIRCTPTRAHSVLGNLTPSVFEQKWQQTTN